MFQYRVVKFLINYFLSLCICYKNFMLFFRYHQEKFYKLCNHDPGYLFVLFKREKKKKIKFSQDLAKKKIDFKKSTF